MTIQEMLLTPNNYSRPMTRLERVTKIAVHYVGNPGSSAVGNRNYFNSLASTHSTYASSHYIVGLSGEIIQCVPESEIAYCTNQANSYSISIENCHPKADGKFTEATEKSLMELCAHLCSKYKLDPMKDIIRHYDVTGKHCPLYWVTHPEDFTEFKKRVKAYMENGGIDMNELKKLQESNDALAERVKVLEEKSEKVFMTLDDLPKWGRPTVEKLMKANAIQGDGQYLDISYTFLRLVVVLDRMGCFDKEA